MKKKLFSFAFLLIVISACNEKTKETSHQRILIQYLEAYNNFDLEKAAFFIHDSIVVSENEFIQTTGKTEWLTQSQWDFAFIPEYSIIETKAVDGNLEATIEKTCKRIKFLNDSAIISKSLIKFLDGKISGIHIHEYVKFDFEKWQSRRDSLVAWIDINHPELSGFIYDQTKSGAEKYLKAIDYYEKK
ncbi:MAG: hypothetical protein K9H16_12130 [Bacteroidales bacterium]|nr:hypothetical protein [Bacteroidales bacterium]